MKTQRLKTAILIIYSAVYLLTMTGMGDDAYISMRYAYNLAHHGQLTWNLGEYVMGYTNPGWTIIMAGIHLLNLPMTWNPVIMQVLNLGIMLYLINYLWEKEGWLAGILIALSGCMIIWSQFGFESTLQAVLVTRGYYDRKNMLWWFLGAFAVRSDGIVWLMIGVVWLAYEQIKNSKLRIKKTV